MRTRICSCAIILLLAMGGILGGCLHIGEEGEGDDAPLIHIERNNDGNISPICNGFYG